MLSDAEARLLGELRATPDAKLCALCAARRLRARRWDVLQSIRELIAQGEVACQPSVCSVCGDQQQVAFLRPPSSARHALKRHRVLIVDDIEDIREMYAMFLRDQGFDVTTAPDGQTALAFAQQEPPDIILLDLTMSRMHGLEVTRSLKTDERTRWIPVLIVTASDSRALLNAALAAGASGYCIRPCVPEALVQEVTRLLPAPR
jgi:CheY-like chemotaxis protein